MTRRPYAAGVAVLVTLLLSAAIGIEWVDVGVDGVVNQAEQPALQAPAGAALMTNQAPQPGLPPATGGEDDLDYVYLDYSYYTGNYWPWYPSYSGFRCQWLYHASEIGRSGQIAQMALFKSYYSYQCTFPNVSVKLCHTSLTSLNTTYSSNYDGNSPVWVFHQNSGFKRGGTTNAWDTVDFQTNFDYNGTSNLLLEITWIGSASGSGQASWCTYYSTSGYRRVYASNISDTMIASGSRDYYIYNTRLGFVGADDDVGMVAILSPNEPFYAWGEYIWPRCIVKNFGLNDQTNVPVHCQINPKGDPTKVYNQTVTIASLEAGETDTIDFTVPFVCPSEVETLFYDTMWVELAGDSRPSNNYLGNTIKVTQWGAECLTYNDGTFDNAISWVTAGGELATRFVTPTKPLPINKVVLWMSSFSGNDYASEVRLYGNDGSGGAPGTLLGSWVGDLHTEIWASLYKNEIMFDPAVSVNYDTFYVSYYQTSITPNYPYLGMDYTSPVTSQNDWGYYQPYGYWAVFPYDGYMDFGLDACYQAPLIDGKVVSIDYPPAEIDSNTMVTPVFTVGNAGLRSRPDIPAVFDMIDSMGMVVLSETVNTGPMAAGATKQMTCTQSYTPHPGYWTDSAYTLLPYDGDPDNDWFVQSLFVIHLNVKVEIISPRIQEVPGLVPVTIRLVNMGNVPAFVPRLDVTIMPSTYADYAENIALGVGGNQVVSLNPWVCPGNSQDTCTAWITYAADMYPPDDTMIRPITAGVPGWAQMRSLPAPPSGKFIKDGGWMAYDASGDLIYASKGYKTGDFYAYHVNGDSWSTLTSWPLGAEGKPPYKGSIGCADGNGMIYATKGYNTVGFWSYDAATKAWTQLTNVPTGGSGKKVKQGAGIAWANAGKVGHPCAFLLKGYKNEFYRYDPVTNEWRTLLDAPIGPANHVKWNDGSWLVADADDGNMLYAFKSKYHEFYKYDTDADTWSHPLNAMPIPGSAGNKKAKTGSCAAWYTGKIYAFKGGNTNEFWRYWPMGDTWQKQDDIPLWGNSGTRKKVKAGAALAGHPGTGLYAFKGNKTLDLWHYTPYDVAAGAQPNRDGVTAGGVNVGAATFAIAPNPLAGGLATVRYNLPKAGLATLNVFDVTGRTVLTQTLAAGRSGTANLDLRKLEAGVYLVKVTTEGFSTTQKLVVEH